MRIEYQLYHWAPGKHTCDDDVSQFSSVSEAAKVAGFPHPQGWIESPDDRGYHRPAEWSTDADRYSISRVKVPETDAERIELAIEMLMENGTYDGDHHKMWTIDQALRILAGDRYDQLITEYCDGEDGPDTYEWDEGVAP
jgi:hypothetical protein